MAEDIKVSFVIRKDCRDTNDCSEDMQLAFVTCEGHRGGGLQPRWVKETELTDLDKLTKRDVFVLNEFAGEIFEKLKATKCLLVGPRCLSCCLTEGTPIPSGPEPVFTVAMRGLVVSASGMTKKQKESIKRKVQWMGGIYSNALTDETTHLVSDSVLSDKYIKSVEKGIPVMSEAWIEAVWQASLQLNVNGSSPDFVKHKLPPFTNLQVTTSGISKKDKQMIMKLVNEGGGTFSGAFQSETTDVVILTKEGVGSEKYKAALEYGKACALPAWVKDSASQGVALPLAKYRVVGASTSSPLAEHRLPDMSLNFSRITNLRPPSNFVDETRSADISTLSGRMKLSQDTRKSSDAVDKDVQTAFENFDMSLIKKAGPIFDGFCIWVTGPEGGWRERANACVSRGGGVRYSAPHSRVTHIVSGSGLAAAAAAKELPTVPVVSALWLLKSIEAGKAVDETQYLLDPAPSSPLPSRARAEPASPMSARTLQLLRRAPPPLPPPVFQPVNQEPEDEALQVYLSRECHYTFYFLLEPPRARVAHEPPPPPVFQPEVNQEPEDEALQVYLSQAAAEPARDKTPEPPAMTSRQEPDVTDDVDEPTDEVEQIFKGMKIEVHGLEEEAICEIGAEVSAAGGCLVAAGAGGSHALVPLDFAAAELPSAVEPVTVFWIKDCLSQQELVPIQYYHRPVVAAPSLGGVVASLSTYSGVERAFLDELARLLGATTQLRFCRRTTANALASTHLICPTPSGDKYQGAVKWGLPAVTAQWLLDCAEKGERVPEGPYLLPGTKAPKPPPPEQAAPPQSPPKSPVQTDQVNKENAMLPPAEGATVPRRNSMPSRDNTPKGKPGHADDNDMSPASRYIAMARQGLLGCDSQETPKRVGELRDDAKQDGDVRTPPLDDALSTPNLRCLSPTTRRRLQAVKRGEMPSDPIRTPTDPFEKNRTETPDSAFGAALRPGSGRLSPDARKRLWQFVQELPGKEPQTEKQKQTPLSEIRNRFLAQFNGDAPTPPSDSHSVAPRKLHLQDQEDTPPHKMAKFSMDQSPGTATTNRHSNHETPKPAIPTTPKPTPLPNNTIDASKLSTIDATKASTPEAKLGASVDLQLQRLSAALSARGSTPVQRHKRTRDSLKPLPGPESEAAPESQPNTVGWDDRTPAEIPTEPPATQPKRFMLSSNVDNREDLMSMIIHLGGEVSDGSELDPSATHLLCAAPARSEKMLGSIAHGKWVLHPAYVARSRANGAFLNEEEYEWGNDLATCLPPLGTSERTLARAAHRWRVARAQRRPGAFSGVVALLHVPAARRRLLARLLRAGDGEVVEAEPPYNCDGITVCFADIKRYPLSARDAAWLRSRRVPVCAPVVLSTYLTDDARPNVEELCLPEFRP
ncbi:hypothetical protein JYU34_011508 [Plutella xylostella]|uniref:BRCT domain-containing protein n=1 Tax=Plutella xylostella TaxID=51655 RepID=A0ABQ7QH54_PLUXY|nr:hypothetical protein JYU34_011508 [Plutella xylostella]